MTRLTIAAFVAALLTGIALGIQATINSRLGEQITPLNTGLLVTTVGGLLSAAVFAILMLAGQIELDGPTVYRHLPAITLAGMLAALAIIGTAFALPKLSVSAGVAAIIFGQMLVSLIVDTTGWGGVDQVPLSLPRLGGLVLLAISVWLLMPHSS